MVSSRAIVTNASAFGGRRDVVAIDCASTAEPFHHVPPIERLLPKTAFEAIGDDGDQEQDRQIVGINKTIKA